MPPWYSSRRALGGPAPAEQRHRCAAASTPRHPPLAQAMVAFLCVACYDCKVYQVIQKTKVPKFTCKLCSAKQSIRKVFLRSERARDVRLAVQQLVSRASSKHKWLPVLLSAAALAAPAMLPPPTPPRTPSSWRNHRLTQHPHPPSLHLKPAPCPATCRPAAT
jgi:ribosomal protein S27E